MSLVIRAKVPDEREVLYTNGEPVFLDELEYSPPYANGRDYEQKVSVEHILI